MSKPFAFVLFLAFSAVGVASAQAASPDPAATPRVDKRQVRQQQRIDQGVASGQLTPAEQTRLNAQQARVGAAETRAKSDGVVTAGERARLEQKQDRASRTIRRNKHDTQKN